MPTQTFRYFDNTGGVNLRSNEAKINKSQQATEFFFINNMEIYREGGFTSQRGNTQLNTSVTDETAVLGIGYFFKGSTKQAVYVKASGSAYAMTSTGGADGTAIKTGLDTAAIPQFTNFNGHLICSNGVDAPWAWDGTSANDLTSTPTHWNTDKPIAMEAHRGTRLFSVGGSTLRFSAGSNRNDWTSPNDSGGVTDTFSDFTNYTAITNYGQDLILHKDSGRIYRIVGQTYDEYAILPLASNRSAIGKLAHANINDFQFFFTGDEILPLTTTELGVVKLGKGADISYKIKPFFTGTESDMPIRELAPALRDETILLPYYKRNELVGYFKTVSNTNYDTAAIFNFNTNSWVFRQATTVTAAAVVDKEIFTGTTDGKILKEFSGTTIVGSNSFDKKIVSPFFDFALHGQPNSALAKKTITHVYLWFKAAANLDATIKFKTDYDPTTVDQRSITSTGSALTAYYGTGKYGAGTYVGTLWHFVHFPLNVHGRNFQFELVSDDPTQDYRLIEYAFEVDYGDPY